MVFYEHVDRGKSLQAITAFSECPTLIIDEAVINENNKKLPHGNMGFLVTSSDNAMVGVVLVGDEEQSVINPGLSKSESSMGGKERGMFLSQCL